MERFIADLVQNLDSGRIDRREFCQAVALAAAVYGAGDATQAQAQRGFKIIGINHMSYTCPDYTKARDWYASVLNMKSETTRDDGNRANLMFGPEPGKGGSFLVTRSPSSTASGSAGVKPGAEAVIDHRLGFAPGRPVTGRRIERPRAADDVGQRHIVGTDAVGLLALFAERERHVACGGTDLVQIEDQ